MNFLIISIKGKTKLKEKIVDDDKLSFLAPSFLVCCRHKFMRL